MHSAAVITVSDSRSTGSAVDLSGPAVAEILANWGIEVTERQILADDGPSIGAAVRALIDKVRIVVTTGGTGVGPRDVTPEAIRPLFDRELPGFGEIMRCGGYAKTPLSIISRGGAGVAGRTLIVMLPGSPKGVREGLELLGPAIKHLLKLLSVERLDCQGEVT